MASFHMASHQPHSSQGDLGVSQVGEVEEEGESALPRIQTHLYPQGCLAKSRSRESQWLLMICGQEKNHQLLKSMGLWVSILFTQVMVEMCSIFKPTMQSPLQRHFSISSRHGVISWAIFLGAWMEHFEESLCGNSKTVMMAAISPNFLDYDSWMIGEGEGSVDVLLELWVTSIGSISMHFASFWHDQQRWLSNFLFNLNPKLRTCSSFFVFSRLVFWRVWPQGNPG